MTGTMTRTVTRPCACGGTIEAPDAMGLWMAPVLRHVRTPRHRSWARRRTVRTFDFRPPRLYEEHLDSWLGPLVGRAS